MSQHFRAENSDTHIVHQCTPVYTINQHTPLFFLQFVCVFCWFDWLITPSRQFARRAGKVDRKETLLQNHKPEIKHEWEIFFGLSKDRKTRKRGESCFKQSQCLMNRHLNPKRDISETILPALFPVTVLLDEAWLWHRERREVISLTERLWFFTLMRESHRGDEMKTVEMEGAAHHPCKRKSINQWRLKWKRGCDVERLELCVCVCAASLGL